ncbi:alkaline phosphatase family protein [Sphingomonas sp. RG327]|uniref:Alkaline phosphatase n=1 Tax=Sphingomonas anseongensis TaxID=2908207 RepID=A0ABT0RD38_9SPHN|nr:alkaline phosphatase family protein [Sphingomonas anseongensis]MCL6678161.1 alkaline phosphatase family protein [Sphingomonas anseongensis]
MRILPALSAAFVLTSSIPAAAQVPAAPKLLIVISVDQFGADLFDEYRPRFTAGLARLSSGTVFRNGYQGQAATETCPGHSTILTGSLPARTGIIANSWIDQSAPRADKKIYCAEDERVPGSTYRNYTVSAVHLKVPTLGDILKKLSPDSQNVAVAGKDRSAVMMSGHSVDQRWYWNGKQFVTDLASAPAPRSIALANAGIARLVATAEAPLDPPPYCQTKAKLVPLSSGVSVGGGRLARAAGDYEAFRASPDFDGATLAVAAGLIQDMKLGRDRAPDVLSIALSATDYLGHTYGSEGEEMCLQMYALDRELGDFFRALDAMHLDYAVALTADHGVEDIPERSGGARADPALAPSAMGTKLGQALGLPGPLLAGGIGGDVYLAPSIPSSERAKALAEAVRLYREHPQVAAVFTKDELGKLALPTGAPSAWTLEQRARASFDRERSGDLVVLLKERVSLLTKPTHGDVATHGSAWDYDRRVPILFWRAGMAASDRAEAIETPDIMPTLAAMIGIPIEASSIDGHCLQGIASIACPSR